MNFDSVDSFLRHIGVGRRSLDDPFFDDTYKACKVFRRTGITVEDEEDLCHRVMEEFQCSAPDCDEAFRNLTDYEIHYNGLHRYTCEECKITRPNARLLEIHIQETHDSFFNIVSQKRPMYQCYVSECNEKFSGPEERIRHCLRIHKFPENFRFYSGEWKNGDADSVKVERRKEAEISVEEDSMEISGEIIPPCFSERLCASENLQTVPSSFRNINEPRYKGCDYIDPYHCARQRLLDDENVESSIKKQDPTLEIQKCLPQLDQNIYANILKEKTCVKRNILESDNLMDLLDELPD